MDTSQPRSDWGLVILAAGRSSRFGDAKQVALFQGRPLVTHAAHTALSAAQHAAPIRIVTGAYREQVAQAVAPLLRRHANLALCHNDAWTSGLASSLQAGLQSLACVRPRVEAVVFLLGDQPRIPDTLLTALRERWIDGWEMAAPAQAGHLLGVPALFARAWWPAIHGLEGDRGARPLLEQHRSQVGLVEVDADCLIDIDTLEDLAGYGRGPSV